MCFLTTRRVYMMLNSFDEWSPLKEVIVGSPIHYEAQELELSFKLFFHDEAYAAFWYPYYETEGGEKIEVAQKKTPIRKLSSQYLEELAEDVEGLVNILESLNIKVHRPITLEKNYQFKTPYWEAATSPALNVRDQVIIIGNEIVETPPQVRGRYFENDLLKPIFYDYFKKGSRWTTMPKPMMTD